MHWYVKLILLFMNKNTISLYWTIHFILLHTYLVTINLEINIKIQERKFIKVNIIGSKDIQFSCVGYYT